METEKVSVIIPVYNMERYLDRCVESVLRQSYSKLEIILVDDGSADHSGTLCDEWADRDPRIRVIHKKNGGLSDARNAGIDISTGEYLTFIDSDDYVADNMIERLYTALTTNQADMSICNFSFVDEDGNPLSGRNPCCPVRDETITGAEAISKLALDQGWVFHLAWNKLYKKELFSDIRYPVGKYAEDAFIGHRLFGKCNRISCISDVCCYYTQRSGSIMHSKTAKSYLHDVESYLDRAIYCYEKGLSAPAARAYWTAAMFFPRVGRFDRSTSDLETEYRETLSLFRNYLVLSADFTPKEKIQIRLISLSPRLYRSLVKNRIWQGTKTGIKRALHRN